MPNTVRFEENLYFINELINALEDGLSLKLDRHFFFDKIVEDIFFIDATLNKLYSALNDNNKIVHALQIMRSLQTTKQRFISLLEKIIAGSTGLEDAFLPFEEKLKELQVVHTRDCSRIQETLAEESPATPREGISPEEYQFLFPGDEEET